MTPPEDAWMYRTLWFVVNDVLCASNAPVLLALNKPVRSVYMRKIGMEHKELHSKGSLLHNIWRWSMLFCEAVSPALSSSCSAKPVESMCHVRHSCRSVRSILIFLARYRSNTTLPRTSVSCAGIAHSRCFGACNKREKHVRHSFWFLTPSRTFWTLPN